MTSTNARAWTIIWRSGKLIANDMDVAKILRKSARSWDGGYTIAGILGHGDAFVMRDPIGIRPAYYFYK